MKGERGGRKERKNEGREGEEREGGEKRRRKVVIMFSLFIFQVELLEILLLFYKDYELSINILNQKFKLFQVKTKR